MRVFCAILFASSFAFGLSLACGLAFGADSAENRAWFLFTKELGRGWIHLCAKAKTPAEAEEIAQLAEWSQSAWDAFYAGLRADLGDWGGPNAIEFRLLADIHPTCTGDEDLTIYYGVEDARVQAVKKLYANPLGFAHLESFDESNGAARGFIWISDAPEVRMHENHRRMLLLHEMGHVYGLGHVPGTVMEENFADTLTRAYRSGTPFDPKSRRQAFGGDTSSFWINFEQDIAGWTDISYAHFDQKADVRPGSPLAKAMFALTGQNLIGPRSIGFQKLVSWPDETTKEWEPKGKGRLDLCTEKCKLPEEKASYFSFKAEYGKPYWLPLGEEKLFRAVYHGQEQFIPRRAQIIPGIFIDTKTGRRTEFLMQQNGNDLELNLLIGGEKIRLL